MAKTRNSKVLAAVKAVVLAEARERADISRNVDQIIATLESANRKLRFREAENKDSLELQRLKVELTQLQRSYDSVREENERLARTLQSKTPEPERRT